MHTFLHCTVVGHSSLLGVYTSAQYVANNNNMQYIHCQILYTQDHWIIFRFFSILKSWFMDKNIKTATNSKIYLISRT